MEVVAPDPYGAPTLTKGTDMKPPRRTFSVEIHPCRKYDNGAFEVRMKFYDQGFYWTIVVYPDEIMKLRYALKNFEEE